jgi:DNA-binding beta-propeller fold protein YncE
MLQAPSARRTRRLWALTLALALAASSGAACQREAAKTGAALFASPQIRPVALSADQQLLFVANTTSGSVSVLDVRNPRRPRLLAEIDVGLDPAGIAVRPKVTPGRGGEDELIFVTNYISDSISVISRQRLDVVDTLQEIDPQTGVTRTDEPSGIAFAGPHRAFVTLEETNEVWVLELDDAGRHVGSSRIPITAPSPRALAVSGDRLYVAAFESGNQTEFPSCGPDDPRGPEEGCEFHLRLIDHLSIDLVGGQPAIDIQLGVLFDFAASDPNIGGKVIMNPERPDRDVFVFDLTAPGLDSDPSTPGIQPLQVIEGMGTLLYGIAVGKDERVYVTNTDARNDLNGLLELGNRMFDNRLSILDCAGGCAGPLHVDLDQAAGPQAGIPTPFGVEVSADGQMVLVTGAGSDGLPPGYGGTHPDQPELFGLAVLDAEGHVLGGTRVGAIPQGVALRSHPGTGAGEYAFVLNTVGNTVDVVDVRDPAAPKLVTSGIRVGSDPTPPVVQAGRIHFMSARASASGNFSCESCHPNGNIDQVLWTINAIESPDDPGPFVGEIPEPRTTMPIRGLRDTLPLHWEGNLSDPFPGPGGGGHIGPSPGCEPGAANEVACIRDLVNASLSGVMCEDGGGCPAGPSGQAGGLTHGERDELSAFLASVSYAPSPNRRPTDRLSDLALLGVQDFFTNEDGMGINTGVGEVVNFAPATCADNPLGCHSLPLTHSTKSPVVGGFDAPGIRGMVDRHILFSNGIVSSEEALRFAQACADGFDPPARMFDLLGFPVLEVTGDPCNLRSPVIENIGGLPLMMLPFPSGSEIYRPEQGITERGAFLASFEFLFALVYGVRGERIWEYQTEVSVGLPGITGRQHSITPENAHDAETLAALALFEATARDGKIVAIARNGLLGALRYGPGAGRWLPAGGGSLPPGLEVAASKLGFGQEGLTSAALRGLVESTGQVVTITAELPPNVSIGGPDRQPLLFEDPDLRAAEQAGEPPSLPRPNASAQASFRLGAKYVEPGAKLLVNGAVCHACSFSFAVAATGEDAIDVVIPADAFEPGINVMQVLNPLGWASNEFPLVADL